jgi:hypothetical protein
MAPRARETAADSAARFLAARARKLAPYRGSLRAESVRQVRQMPRRIAMDFAEPTLRAICDALRFAVSEGELGGNRLALTMIAYEMVATQLGEDIGDDPPLTDREAP